MPTLETFLVQKFAHEILKIGFDILLLIFVLRKLCTALLFSETSTSCNLLWHGYTRTLWIAHSSFTHTQRGARGPVKKKNITIIEVTFGKA